MGRILTTLVATGLALAIPRPTPGQVKPSEAASITQIVDGAIIAVEYSRPRARGRSPLFGDLVAWGAVWTPGANDATVLAVDRDFEIEGMDVPAGRWSVWLVPREAGPWELVLDPRDGLWHTAHPDATEDQVRLPVDTESVPHVETLSWTVPDVRHDGVTLAVAWGDVRVPLELRVEPTYAYTLARADAEPFLGAWTMEGSGRRREGEIRMVEILHHEDGSLRARGHDPDVPDDDGFEWILRQKADGVFSVATTRDGAFWSSTSSFLEMSYGPAGEADAFAVRNGRDDIVWAGRRAR